MYRKLTIGIEKTTCLICYSVVDLAIKTRTGSYIKARVILMFSIYKRGDRHFLNTAQDSHAKQILKVTEPLCTR